MKNIVLSAFAAVFMLAGSVHAEKAIAWSDLIDQTAQTFDDPYQDLSYDQMEALRTIVRSRSKLEAEDVSSADQVMFEQDVQNAKAALEEDGIDADWLIDQRWVVKERREKAANAGNPAVDGVTVTLSGFAVLAPPDADGSSVAYLVPERGMCSHMPPPAANQMVKVRLTDDWQPAYTHEPVRLTGKMSIAPSQRVFSVVDGVVQMQATFLLNVQRVETVADIKAQNSSAINIERGNKISKKLRASSPFTYSLKGFLK